MNEDIDFLDRGRAVVLAGYLNHNNKIDYEEVYGTIKSFIDDFAGVSGDVLFRNACAKAGFSKVSLNNPSIKNSSEKLDLFIASRNYIHKNSEKGYIGIGEIQFAVEISSDNLESLIGALQR